MAPVLSIINLSTGVPAVSVIFMILPLVAFRFMRPLIRLPVVSASAFTVNASVAIAFELTIRSFENVHAPVMDSALAFRGYCGWSLSARPAIEPWSIFACVNVNNTLSPWVASSLVTTTPNILFAVLNLNVSLFISAAAVFVPSVILLKNNCDEPVSAFAMARVWPEPVIVIPTPSVRSVRALSKLTPSTVALVVESAIFPAAARLPLLSTLNFVVGLAPACKSKRSFVPLYPARAVSVAFTSKAV